MSGFDESVAVQTVSPGTAFGGHVSPGAQKCAGLTSRKGRLAVPALDLLRARVLVYGLGFRVEDLRFRVKGLGFKV